MYVVPLNSPPVAGGSFDSAATGETAEASGGFASLLEAVAALLAPAETSPVSPEVTIEGENSETVDETEPDTEGDASAVLAEVAILPVAPTSVATVALETAAGDVPSETAPTGALDATSEASENAAARGAKLFASKGVTVPVELTATAERASPQPELAASAAAEETASTEAASSKQVSPDADDLLQSNLRLQGLAALARATGSRTTGEPDATEGTETAAQSADEDGSEGSLTVRRAQAVRVESVAAQAPIDPAQSADEGPEFSTSLHRVQGESAITGRPNAEAASAFAASTNRAGPEPTPTPTTRSSGSENVAAVSASGDTPRESVTVDRSAAAPRPPVPAQAIAETAIRNVRYLVSSGDEVVTVRLVPKSLGELHITVRSGHDQIQVHLASANPAVREALEGHLSSLRDALNRDGIDVSRATVSSSTHGGANTGGTFREALHDGSRGFDSPIRNADLGEETTRPMRPTYYPKHHSGTLDVFV